MDPEQEATKHHQPRNRLGSTGNRRNPQTPVSVGEGTRSGVKDALFSHIQQRPEPQLQVRSPPPTAPHPLTRQHPIRAHGTRAWTIALRHWPIPLSRPPPVLWL
ncbi:hypothetical protein FQN60_006148 [Etheostoma spectabile]|uniref:Uncharacterized protein n=1 Tax=Etheostoma spectabile TaxID=54343 RepID=A0A5J5CLA5_9PERO|nr:hypothetical protein FQN60_006148 [Etheostoma spectabile]